MENRISIPRGGLKKSIDPRNLSDKDLTHALNTSLFDTDGDYYDISYEKSNILSINFPEGYLVIGRVNRLKNNSTYYFLTNPLTQNSLFGVVDNNKVYDDSILENNLEEVTQTPYKEFKVLLDDSCTEENKFNFSELHPIQNIVLKEEKTGGVIYFTDFINPSRYIEIDAIEQYFIQEVPCDDDEVQPCMSTKTMRIHKLYLLPKISNVSVSSGGSLGRGTYSFLVALSDAMGNEVSEYTSITQPIGIWSNSDNTTDKAIRLEIDELDTNYTHYKIAVLFNQHLDNAQNTHIVGIFPTTNKEVIVSSIYNLERVSYETLTYVNVRVTNSENLTTFNNQLAEYGLVYERELNLQPVVNMMGSYLKWQTHIAREDLYTYPDMQYKYTGYNRNETVPFSIRFLKKGGSTTALFPLVGREANAIDLQTINNLDVDSVTQGISCGDNIRTERWKLYNTATVEGGCGTPDDFVEIEEVYTWTCTDDDTARTGAGYLEIEGEYADFTTLEDYYEDNGCFANLCTVLNSNLASQVSCNNSPCNNNPQLVDSVNFISDEINVRISNLYDYSGKLAETAENTTDPYYYFMPDLGTILTGTTLTYSIGTFEQRLGNIETVWSSAPYIPTISSQQQLLSYKGYVYPINSFPLFSPPTDFDDTKIQDGQEVLYKLPYHQSNTLFHINRGTIDKAKFLRFNLNKKFDNPIPSEAVNQEDFRFIISVDDYPQPPFDPNLTSAQMYTLQTQANYERTIVFSGYISEYKDKNIIIEPISDKVSDGLRIVVLNASGQVENTYQSTNTHYSRGIWLYIGTGSVYLDTENRELFLSPRYSFQPYFEDVKVRGKRIEWDDIVIGTTVNYKDTCITLEPRVKSCEAVSYQKGSFSYHESGLNYPDNQELWDSSKLVIKQGDIPSQYRQEFEQKFTSGTSLGQYKIKDSYNLACKPIRHFRFPDNKIAPFIQNTTLTPFSESYIYPLGVTIDENIINMFLDIAVNNDLITQEERDEIYSYELFRGDLSTNRSIIASGLLYDTRQYTEKSKTVEYLNYPYNSYSEDFLNPDSSLKNGFGQRGSNFGFHSPETDYYEPTIPTELNVQGYQFGYSKGYFDEVNNHPKMVILSPKAYSLASTLATMEVIADSVLEGAKALTNVGPLWIVAGAGSSGTNTGGYIAGVAAAALVTATIAAEGIVYGYAKYRLQWQETFKNMGQQRNFAHYYFSEGNYNYLKTNQTEGNIVRNIHFGKKIKDSRYVISDAVDKDKVELNNIDREYTTFLKLGEGYKIDYPSDYSNYDKESLTYSSREGINSESRSEQIQKKIASPYVQLVNNNPTQHGQIDSITWLYTGYRGDLEMPQSGCLPIFGGDTYITRHTLKRKIPLFLTTNMGQANMTPFDYKVANNIGKTPRFYVSYDATSEFDSKGKIFPEVVSDYSFDNTTQKGNYIVPPSKFYLYYYGVPSFLTETRINTNYREWDREPGDNFYPNVGDLGWWTQESNVSIRTPNFYKYTRTYSNQVNIFNHRSLKQTFKQEHQNILDRSVNGVIFSLPDINENGQIDPWLKFRPLDNFEFESKYGKLKELKGIENESILARFEHTAIIYNKVSSTVDDGTSPSSRLGGKDIFQRRTASFVNSELGFGGTQQAESLSCEYGHFYTDTKRGQIMRIPSGGGNMVEISSNTSQGQPTFMRDWFKRNLPFKILNSKIEGIQDLDVDNNYNGIGITMGYDSLHRRILITKKDYLPLDDCIKYSRELGFYTTCGTDVEYSCPPGYTFNSVTNTCDREVFSELCPSGYQYDPINNNCFQQCSLRFAFVLDNRSSGSLTLAINYFTSILNSVSGNAQVALYNAHGTNLTIQEDLDKQSALAFLSTYVGQTSTDYMFAEAACLAGTWLNQEPESTRVLNTFILSTREPTVNTYNCVDSQTVGIYDMSDYYKDSGVTIIGTGDRSGTADILNFYSDNMFFTTGSITQPVINFYQSLSCDDDLIIPIDCDCQVAQEQCVCIESVPPFVSETEKVFTHDSTKFKDVGWTVSYDPSSEMFHSFMDYKPNYYTSMQGYFESGLNNFDATSWSHGITNKSYGVFYGDKYPMEVETLVKASLREYVGNIELLTESKRYFDQEDFYINPDLTFNKSIIYNRKECSGQLVLDLVKGLTGSYPITEVNQQRIPITKTENTFNYNYFFDRVDKQGIPFINNDENQIKISLDNIIFKGKSPLPRINGDWFYNRLSYDTDSRFNLTMKLHKSLTNLDKL